MMKKIVIFTILLALVIGLLPGCSLLSGNEPIHFQYKLSESSVNYFLENDSTQTIVAYNPFYAGAQPLPFPGAIGYEKAKAEKAKYILSECDTMCKLVDESTPAFEAVRTSLMNYFEVVLKEKPESGMTVRDAFLKISKFQTSQALANARYKVLRSSEPQNTYVNAYMDYEASAQAVECANLAMKDAQWLFAYAAIIMNMFEGTGNSKLVSSGATLDQVMQNSPLQDSLKKIYESREKISFAFRQIESADYYFARASSAFIAENIPTLKEKAAKIDTTNFSQSEIDFIHNYLQLFESFNNEVAKNLDAQDQEYILAVATPMSKAGTVYAASRDSDFYFKSEEVLKQAPPSTTPSEGYFSTGWGYVKSAYQKATTGFGVAIDSTAAIVNTVNSVGIGLYYGNTASEISEHVAQGFTKVKDNYNSNISGSDHLKTATEYFEGAEDLAGSTSASAVEATIGKGYTSWAVGGIAKLTAGMFTGLGKGISKVGNKKASTGDIVEGGLDIAFSFVGGSKVLINTKTISGTTLGLAKEGKLLLDDGIKLVGDRMIKADIAKASKETAKILSKSEISQKEVLKLLSNSYSIEIYEGMRAEFAANRAKILEEFMNILKQGGSAALQDAKMEMQQELKEKLKIAFKANISGIIEAMKVNIGGDALGYADNLIGALIDNYLGNSIGDYLDKIACTATIDDLVGTYNGSALITDVFISEVAQQKGTNGGIEGCDIPLDQLKQLQGKSLPQRLTIAKTGPNEGTLTINASETESENAKTAFQYQNGQIACSFAKDGFSSTYDLSVVRMENKVVLKGSMVMGDSAGNLKITADISAEK